MSQMLNRKYRNKCSLHIADHLRGEAELSTAPRRLAYDPDRYVSLGFLFPPGERVDPQEFTDFWHMQWYRIELESDLKMGVLPSGLLLRCPGGEVRVVHNSELVPLDGELEVVK